MKSKKTNTTAEFSTLPDDALVRLAMLIVWALIPFSVSTLWRKVRVGEFPAPVKVSSQVTAWRVGDIRRWLTNPSAYAASGNSGAADRGLV
jgi:prophage regulatory protein